jgi:phosphoribosyl 1,2-cyclic phosphodiesterase
MPAEGETTMKVTFWGTRGSLPTPLGAKGVRMKLVNALVKAAGKTLDTLEKAEAFCNEELSFAEAGTFGGNTSCVQVDTGGEEYLLCDLGSGVREFSLAAIGRHGPGKPQTYHVLLSHVHWDHIMGFPFFIPCFIPGNRIILYSCHPHVEKAIRNQNHEPCFPVEFEALGATIEFVKLEVNTDYDIAGCKVRGTPQLHGNASFGYRIEKDGKAMVYTTDAEHKPENKKEMDRAAAFFKDADLVIFDAMYSFAESVSVKEDWGHSSNIMGVELCQMANARKLCLFHHEPVYDDQRLEGVFEETIRFEEITRSDRPLDVVIAYDGLVLDV